MCVIGFSLLWDCEDTWSIGYPQASAKQGTQKEESQFENQLCKHLLNITTLFCERFCIQNKSSLLVYLLVTNPF